MYKQIMMLDIDLNKKYINLNSSPVSSSENDGMGAEGPNDVPAVDGPILTEISREPSPPPIPDESSSQSLKKRGRKMSLDVPAGWTVKVTVREGGKTAGRKDKYYFEPLTGKRFKSMAEVGRHIADSTPSDKKPGKNQVC